MSATTGTEPDLDPDAGYRTSLVSMTGGLTLMSSGVEVAADPISECEGPIDTLVVAGGPGKLVSATVRATPRRPPQIVATQAADLHALLQSVGEPGPYVIVGHSFGGAEAVTIATMFPDEVLGLLLLDTSAPTWNTAICAVPDDGSDTAHVFQDLCAQQSKPDNNVEHLDGPTAFAELATIDRLDGYPVIVTTADHHSYAGLAASEEARLNDAWTAGQAHWVSLAPSAQLITVDNTSHNIQLDRPDVVLDQIHQLLR